MITIYLLIIIIYKIDDNMLLVKIIIVIEINQDVKIIYNSSDAIYSKTIGFEIVCNRVSN